MEVSRALIGLHAYTGCDTVSAVAGKGKTSALKFLISNRDTQHTFRELSQNWDFPRELIDKLEAFTCLLYAPNASTRSINELRYHLFCAKRGEVESQQLPPCKHCLTKHTQRANYQAGIWRRCLEQNQAPPYLPSASVSSDIKALYKSVTIIIIIIINPEVPSPVGRVWKIEREKEGYSWWCTGWKVSHLLMLSLTS